MGNIYKDSKKKRDDQEKKKKKENFVFSRGRQTSKPVSYKA